MGWKFLREACSSCLSTDFLEASAALEKTGLGYSSKFSINNGRTSRVFIKRKPEEALQILSAIPDLCDSEIYSWRYAQLPPKCIGNGGIENGFTEAGDVISVCLILRAIYECGIFYIVNCLHLFFFVIPDSSTSAFYTYIVYWPFFSHHSLSLLCLVEAEGRMHFTVYCTLLDRIHCSIERWRHFLYL